MTARCTGWVAGAALVPWPVASGTPLAGYAARTGPATGTLDGLTVGALMLEREGARLALVAADVVAVDAALVGEVAAAAGLSPSELILCASHTHAGPAGIVPRLHPAEPDRLDPRLRARFVGVCADAIAAARRHLEPATMHVGRAETRGVAANRNDPDGPCDPRLSVLAARCGDGALLAVLVHFACHPTVLGAENRLVSADFPGALRRSLAAELGDDPIVPVLFVNGAAADVSTRFTRGGQDAAEVQRIGAALAVAASDALGSARRVDGPLRHGCATVELARRSEGGMGGDLAMAHAALGGDPPGVLIDGEHRRAETRAQGAALLAGMAEIDPAVVPAGIELDAWTLGDIALVAIPGELTAALGRRIADAGRLSPLILGYANGYVGYLADRSAHAIGTYEALASPYAADVGERVAAAAATLVVGLLSADRTDRARFETGPSASR